MPITKNYAPTHVILMLSGLPYMVPSGWVIREYNAVNNDIQQTINPRYSPAIRFSSSTLTVELRLPTGLDLTHHSWSRLLRTALISLSESLSAEQYENINYDEQIPVDAVGMVVMPWHRLRNPEQATMMRGDQLPVMHGYIGHTHHSMAGYLQSLTTSYDPHSGMEVWTIMIQKLNMTSLRRDPPKHDGVPDPSDSGNVSQSFRGTLSPSIQSA